MSQTTTAIENKIVQQHIEGLTFLKEMFLPASLSGELTPDQTVFQPGEATSHIIWNAGHLAWAIDHELVASLGGEPFLPESYTELFKNGSTPICDAHRYPGVAELIANFKKACENAIELLSSMNDEDLNRPVREDAVAKAVFPTVGKLLAGGMVHTGYHIGQISLLRRIQGIPSGFGM